MYICNNLPEFFLYPIGPSNFRPGIRFHLNPGILSPIPLQVDTFSLAKPEPFLQLLILSYELLILLFQIQAYLLESRKLLVPLPLLLPQLPLQSLDALLQRRVIRRVVPLGL
jgi:hypothetical protein